jgi:hypothetical protein
MPQENVEIVRRAFETFARVPKPRYGDVPHPIRRIKHYAVSGWTVYSTPEQGNIDDRKQPRFRAAPFRDDLLSGCFLHNISLSGRRGSTG